MPYAAVTGAETDDDEEEDEDGEDGEEGLLVQQPNARSEVGPMWILS